MFKTVVFAALAVASSVTALPTAVAAPASVYIQIAPPAPRAEAVPRPRRGYEWSPGYWNWNPRRDRHYWVAGSWVRTRPGYVYAQPTWVERDGRWEHRRGAWSRGDRDRDGIPNRMDRDRDGDGVRNRQDSRPDNPRRY